MSSFEHNILLWLQRHRTETGNKFWWFITKIGYSKMWFPLCALLTLLPIGNACRIQLWSGLGLQALIVHVLLKKGCRRQRPFEACPEIVPVGKRPKDRSFPSGHTCISFMSAFIFLQHVPVIGFMLLALASMIAFSRMYLGAHYPTDVLGGFVIAILLSAITQILI